MIWQWRYEIAIGICGILMCAVFIAGAAGLI